MTICWNLDPLVNLLEKKHKIKGYNHYSYSIVKEFGILILLEKECGDRSEIQILLKQEVIPSGNFPEYNFEDVYKKLKFNKNYWIIK